MPLARAARYFRASIALNYGADKVGVSISEALSQPPFEYGRLAPGMYGLAIGRDTYEAVKEAKIWSIPRFGWGDERYYR